jgi:hypothetical protein
VTGAWNSRKVAACALRNEEAGHGRPVCFAAQLENINKQRNFCKGLKPTTIETIRLGQVRLGLGMNREWKEIEFPKEYYI